VSAGWLAGFLFQSPRKFISQKAMQENDANKKMYLLSEEERSMDGWSSILMMVVEKIEAGLKKASINQ